MVQAKTKNYNELASPEKKSLFERFKEGV